MEKKEISTIKIDRNISLSFLGPLLKYGPCSTVLYFALSKEDSLSLDPINQPALLLSSCSIRVFSITLPGHENNLNPKNALTLWAEDLQKENDIISTFVDNAKKAINYLIKENISIPSKIAVMGLSRGGYLALHLAAECPEIKWILGFAPLIDLSTLKEFAPIKDNFLMQRHHPNNLSNSLIDKEIRIYIGNRDIRVGTRNAFSFIEKLAQEASINKKKNCSAELIIYPSIGYKGHGTGKNIFKEGCLWLKEKLLSDGPQL